MPHGVRSDETADHEGPFCPQNITWSEYRIIGCTVFLDEPVFFILIANLTKWRDNLFTLDFSSYLSEIIRLLLSQWEHKTFQFEATRVVVWDYLPADLSLEYSLNPSNKSRGSVGIATLFFYLYKRRGWMNIFLSPPLYDMRRTVCINDIGCWVGQNSGLNLLREIQFLAGDRTTISW